MKPATSPDTLAIPPALLAEIEAAAEREHRPAAEVVREALERYLAGPRRDAAPDLKRRDRRVFRTEDLSEAEMKAIGESRMDSRHDHLNAELE